MKQSILIAGIAALSLAACQRQAEKTTEATPPAEVVQEPSAHPAATIPTPSNETAAPDFVAKAVAGDMFEVESSKIALKRATNATVKTFAQEMVTAHAKTTADLKKAIADSGQQILPPAALPSNLQGKIDDLNKVDAAGLDKKYMEDQIDGHQAALDLFQRYANDGDTAQIKAFAAATAPMIQDHLSRAKGVKEGLK